MVETIGILIKNVKDSVQNTKKILFLEGERQYLSKT
jgi:hypothetical protein